VKSVFVVVMAVLLMTAAGCSGIGKGKGKVPPPIVEPPPPVISKG
jgi:hypothetical protein